MATPPRMVLAGPEVTARPNQDMEELCMAAGIFSVETTPTTGPLSVKQFYAVPPPTPGNVGVCLSGGGSRALTAGMGQLRALNKITANGQSLLAQAKALSTVSGGSWLGVPFIYLPPGSSSDAAYLGPGLEEHTTLTPAIPPGRPARSLSATAPCSSRSRIRHWNCSPRCRSHRSSPASLVRPRART